MDFDENGNWKGLLGSASLQVQPIGRKELVELNRLLEQLESIIGSKLLQCKTHEY